MKKQVLGMAAALFALMLALFVGAYAADTSAAELSAANTAYAILYEDGTLVFQNSNTSEPGKKVTNTYEVDLTAVYGYASQPWLHETESVRVVNFADKISPTSTARWFKGCLNLERVDNIQNLDTINVTDMSYMFYDCSVLTALDLSYFDTTNVQDMTCMFSHCSGLTALDLSRFDTANVTDMHWMFAGCSGLTALDISHFNTTNVESMHQMFGDCSGLTTLDLSHFDTANVTHMSHMFYGCSGLTVLDISHFDTSNVTYMSAMFYDCSGLTTLNLSSFNTANVTEMNGMFEQCPNLKTVYVSDKFTTVSLKLYNGNIFDGCLALVGGNGTKYDESHTDKEYARIDTASTPGYFTYKAAPAPVAYAISTATPDNGKLSVTLSNPAAATVAVSCFGTNGKFVSATLQSVQANAGTVTLPLSAGTRKACVMLFDNDYRPLCVPFAVDIK